MHCQCIDDALDAQGHGAAAGSTAHHGNIGFFETLMRRALRVVDLSLVVYEKFGDSVLVLER